MQSRKEGVQVEEMQRLVDDANAKLEQQKSVARSAAGLHAFPESCCDSLCSAFAAQITELEAEVRKLKAGGYVGKAWHVCGC